MTRKKNNKTNGSDWVNRKAKGCYGQSKFQKASTAKKLVTFKKAKKSRSGALSRGNKKLYRDRSSQMTMLLRTMSNSQIRNVNAGHRNRTRHQRSAM